MCDRNQVNSVPSVWVYGSPSISHPPKAASKSPKARLVDAPRRGDSHGHLSGKESFAGSKNGPVSSINTFTPALARTYPAIPPPAPEPTTITSYSVGDSMICMLFIFLFILLLMLQLSYLNQAPFLDILGDAPHSR